jgi:prepilin-type N-terminal cleavage/methylation domain-containing protein/prepilin-type processing-associated H-X9-DG protein
MMRTMQPKSPSFIDTTPRIGSAQCGWTLVEILVVVFILGVLMALLLPCLNAAREQGRRAVCQARIKQMYYGWHQYADDYEGHLVSCLTWKPQLYLTPPRESTPWLLGRAMPSKPLETLSRDEWREMVGEGALWPYVRDMDMYGCPACPSQLRLSVDSSSLMNVTKTPIRLSYSIAASMGADGPIGDIPCLPPAEPRCVGQTYLYVDSFQQMTSPPPGARVVFLCEGDLRAAYGVFYDQPQWHSPPPVYHRDGTTVVFADGHGEYWKWNDPATLRLGRLARDNFSAYAQAAYAGGTLTPGNPDLERVQRALWGRLGYAAESK